MVPDDEDHEGRATKKRKAGIKSWDIHIINSHSLKAYSLSNIAQIKVEHQHTFKTDTATSVRGRAKLEGVNIGLNCLGINAMLLGTFFKESSIVDTLSAR